MHLRRNGGGGTHSQQSPELSVQPVHVVSATSGPPDAWPSWNGLAAKEADRLPQKPVQVFVASGWVWYEPRDPDRRASGTPDETASLGAR